jgi:hypothetical protein
MTKYAATLYYTNNLEGDSIPFFTKSELFVEANERRIQNELPETNDLDEAIEYLESTDFGVLYVTTQYFNENEIEIIEE